MSLNYLSLLMRSICLVTALALSAMAQAGELTHPDATKGFQWKSTECPRPIEQHSSPGESNQDRLMRYARDIEIYIDCIQREAQRDFEDAQRKMQAAIERDLERQTEIMNGMMFQAAQTMR